MLKPLLDENSVAGVHVRCDSWILSDDSELNTYGFLPFRFIGDRMPSHVRKVVIILGWHEAKLKERLQLHTVVEVPRPQEIFSSDLRVNRVIFRNKMLSVKYQYSLESS